MPMLDFRRNHNNISRVQALCWLSIFLIPAFPIDTKQNLPTTALCVVNVPVVPAARLKGYICNENGFLWIGQRFQIGSSDEILCKCGIWFTLSEKSAVFFGRIVCINFLCHPECSPCIRPACIKCNLCQNLYHFRLADTVFLCGCQMILQGTIYNALTNQGSNRHDRTQLQRKLYLSRPNFSKQYIIVQCCKLRCKCSKGISAGGLFHHEKNLLFSVCFYICFPS